MPYCLLSLRCSAFRVWPALCYRVEGVYVTTVTTVMAVTVVSHMTEKLGRSLEVMVSVVTISTSACNTNNCPHSFQIALHHLPEIQMRGDHEKRFAAGFSPIRITPHFIEPLSSTFRSQLTSETGALMKVLSLINHTLLVYRISGNMTIPPTCDEYAFGPNEGKCRNLHSTTQCGPYIVPHQYLGIRQVCTFPYGSCHDIGGSGIGAANTDFLLFVGTQCKLVPLWILT